MEHVDWDEVDFLVEEGYWPEYSGDYHSREYHENGKTVFTFKEEDFLLDYTWAKDYWLTNNSKI